MHELSAREAEGIQALETGRGRWFRRYFFTDLGTLGGTESFAFSINDLGLIFGLSRTADDVSSHAFLYAAGTMIDLHPLGVNLAGGGINNAGQIASNIVLDGIVSPVIFDSQRRTVAVIPTLGGVSFGFNGTATSINNAGETIGYSYLDGSVRHAFLYRDGLTTDLGSFGGYSAALAVNDAGVVAGFASNSISGRAHAFVYRDGVMLDIDPLGDVRFSVSESYANDVNNVGQVVGQFLTQDQSAFHAFLHDGDGFRDLGSPVSPESVAYAINDQTQVVGVSLMPFKGVCVGENGDFECIQFKQRAVIFEGGQMIDLNRLIPSDSGWELNWAFDINNYGQIVGYGLRNGTFRAFLLTPANKEQCKHGGWRKLGFKNQGRCIQFANAA